MKLRVLPAVIAVALCASALAVAAPATALPGPPTFGTLDLGQPGHVKGTVTTDQPFVRVYTRTDSVMVPTTGGSAEFDLETWGLRSATLSARACPTGTYSNAECSTTTALAFTAADSRPEVTWPADTTIGPGQAVDIAVSDPDGGGALQVIAHGNFREEIDRNGTTALSLPEGTGRLSIYRCSTDLDDCTYFDPALSSPDTYEVRHVTQVNLQGSKTNPPRTISILQPTVTMKVDTLRDESLPYTLDWHFATKHGVEIPDSGGSQSGTLAAGSFVLTLDAAAVPDGTYYVGGTLTVLNPDFGELIGTITSYQASFWPIFVDRVPPTFTSVKQSRTKIFPLVGAYGYDKSVVFEVTGTTAGDQIEIRTPSTDQFIARSLLKRPSPTVTTWKAGWSGRSSETGKIVPAGNYSAYLVDAAGNRGPSVGWVTVSLKKVVVKTFRKKVQASGSTVGKYIGKCSQLKRPVRGWVGSQGYYANTKCGTQTSSASEVNTANQVRLPAALKYDQIRVETYGGSAASKPGSRGAVHYLDTTGKWLRQSVTRTTVTTHISPNVGAARYVWSDRYFVWGFATAFGNRFDVRDFTVVAKYYVLE